MKVPKVYHPILFSVYPVFAMAAANIDVLNPASIGRTLAVSLATGLLVFVLASLLLKNRDRAGLVATLALLLFSTYGHAYLALMGVPIGQADVLAALWAAVFILGTWAILRLLKKPETLTSILNKVTLVLVVPLACFVLVKAGIFYANQAARPAAPLPSARTSPVETGAPLPDIYLIILDGYARADVLDQIYGYDNSPFVDYLESKGFFVAKEAHSNYSQTQLSIPSMMNYAYIDELLDPLPVGQSSVYPLRELMIDNRVQAELEARGYRIVAFPLDFYVTRLENADRVVDEGYVLNSFEQTFSMSTAAILFLDKLIPQWKREDRLAKLAQLPQVVSEPSPKFVFFHLLAPHPPFLFDADGQVNYDECASYDGSFYQGGRDQYLQRYPGQLQYISERIQGVVESILANSPTDPVILIMGDHGPGAYLDWTSAASTCFEERLSILNAYYLPGEGKAKLYDAITPVNTFRVVFDTYFGADLGLLEDRSYFSLLRKPYDWIEVTGEEGVCPAPK